MIVPLPLVWPQSRPVSIGLPLVIVRTPPDTVHDPSGLRADEERDVPGVILREPAVTFERAVWSHRRRAT